MRRSLEEWCKESNTEYLLKDWDYNKNIKISPSNISYGSDEKVHWKCHICEYEWVTNCNSRTSNRTECPQCMLKIKRDKTIKSKILKNGSLEDNYPGLCKEWDYIKNANILPSSFCSGSNEKVWWICSECGNSYNTKINIRTKGSGCPDCASKRRIKSIISKRGSLLEACPRLEKEWHPTKNGDLHIDEVTPGSNKKYWWQCSNGHEWQAAATTRAKGHGCPYCAGFYATKENNLLIQFPEIAKEWHPTKNGDLLPEGIGPYSMKKVWWQCSRGHEWQASVSNRSQGRGCAKCSAELRSSFPEQAIAYYLSKEYNLISRHKINGWEVDAYLTEYNIGIEYDGIVYHDTKKLKEREKRKSHDLINSGLDLIRVKESENQEGIVGQNIYFLIDSKYRNLDEAIKDLCQLLEEKTSIKVNGDINTYRDRIEIMNQYISLEKEKSFASKYPELVALWNYKKNINLKPNNFAYMSNRKVWWICPICGGEWEETIINVSKGNRCPYCSNHKVLKGFNDLETLFPELAKEWHETKNDGIKPYEVTKGSNKKVWWKCKNGHEWRATVNRRTTKQDCPYCTGTHKVIPPRNNKWLEKYELAKEFYKNNGHLEIKAKYICENGVKLGSWIRTQRVCYKNRDITDERIKMLEDIGMIWNSSPGCKKNNHN